ncbi:S8 family serine peptidase [Chitinophagaceae bacterium 26-R-25]|nr:S8 family serine peptidase [Chitinophagaceae bacterium 26-R-25]
MRRNLLRGLTFVFCLGIVSKGFSQVNTNASVLQQGAKLQADKERLTFSKLLTLSKERNWPMLKHGKNGQVMQLVGMDHLGFPLYLSTQNNIISAATIGTSSLWPGGSTGLSLSGSSANMKGKIAVWDGDAVLETHQELTGRVNQKDFPARSIADMNHSTHVAGTMIASGVNPIAKGMSFGAQQLIAYDFNNDMSEMMTEAPNLLLSNHSYAYNAGWVYNDDNKRWEFWGAPDATEDYKFGYYDDNTQLWDSIAYNAPYYLIVKAAGNSRIENGPAVGATYWRMDKNGVFFNAGNRPAGISSNNGYDIITTTGVAKNILTVGAVNPITSGYGKPADVVMTTFSSWGPTDDGRIKPDVCADGLNVTSSFASSNTAYGTLSGTSMASPAATGSLFLLQELYSKSHSGAFLRAATLKAIVIHTADEAGPSAGPDYQFGWGLIDMVKAAAVITSNNTDQQIYEKVLQNGKSDTIKVVASGKGKLLATIVWTDPKATVDNTNTLNNRAKKLVNDLDLRIKTGSTAFLPWILDVANPANAATKGDNITDNVERVEVDNSTPGDTSLVIVTHKGTLNRGSQAYSLIISGVGGNAACASGAINTGGTRIERVTMGSLNYSNTTSCTTYTDNRASILNLEPNQSVPFSITVGSCDATSASSMIKIFIDYNQDGDFDDAGEMVAQSDVLNKGGTFTGTIQTPLTITPGTSFLMRIIAQETTNINDIKTCGTYANGETQDYTVNVVSSSIDVGVLQIVVPSSGYCINPAQYITIRLKNFGSVDAKNIPVTVVVKNGATTVATLTGTYPDTIPGNSYEDFTLQTPVALATAGTYTITASTAFAADQNTTNDATTTSVIINGKTNDVAGRVVICGTDNVSLIADSSSGSGNIYDWYTSATSTTPIATGSYITTNVITSDKKYYLAKNDTKLNIGPADKSTLGVGSYMTEGGQFIGFSSSVPLTLETAKLFVGHSGKVTFIVADTSNTNATNGSYSYVTLSTATIDVYATQASDNSDNGAVFNIGLSIPAGNHVIIFTLSNGATLYRNNGVTTKPYPFTIPGVFSINGNSAGFTSDYQNFYYYLYDMKLRLSNCESSRIAIDATTASPVAPTITLNGNMFTSTSSAGGKLQWLLNNAPIAGATGPTYIVRQAGAYKLVDTTATGCIMYSNEIYYGSAADIDPIVIWPNPNNGNFNLSFVATQTGDMRVVIFNYIGQKVFEQTYNNVSGNYIQQINGGLLASGVYVVRIEQGGKLYAKKMIVHSWK